MYAILSAAAMLASAVQQTEPPQKDFSIDLFLTGGNPSPVVGTDWMDKPENDRPVKVVLRAEIAKMQQRGQLFMLLDGGDCSIFSKVQPRQVNYVVRRDGIFPTLTESWTKNGVAHTRLSNYRRIVTGTSGGINPLPFNPAPTCAFSYINQAFLYLAPSIGQEQRVICQNLVSYRTMLSNQLPQDRVPSDQLVIVSEDSIESTIQEVDKNGDFPGVCFCAWGLPDPAKPNFVSFPPAGVVAHYIFYRKNHHLGLEFLGYSGSPTDYWAQ